MTSVQHANHSSNQYCDMMEQLSQSQQSEQTFQISPIIQNTNVVNQHTHSNIFYYQPPNDLYNYHIKCEEISIQLLNEFSSNMSNINFNQSTYIFFYQQKVNSPIYQIVCEIVSPFFINNILNRTLGIEIEHNIRHEQLTFYPHQKENLKLHLTHYLNSMHL